MDYKLHELKSDLLRAFYLLHTLCSGEESLAEEVTAVYMWPWRVSEPLEEQGSLPMFAAALVLVQQYAII